MDSEQVDWVNYYETVKNRPPRDTLLKALTLFEKNNENLDSIAVDLGAGVGNDTRELISRGWKVYAYDKQEESVNYIRQGIGEDKLHLLQTIISTFESISLPSGVSLINASYSIPFCPPSEFDKLWDKITSSLVSGGRFCGQIFGNEDEWVGDENMTFLNREEMEKLFELYEIEELIEFNEDSQIASGDPKHWHIFHVVARKL